MSVVACMCACTSHATLILFKMEQQTGLLLLSSSEWMQKNGGRRFISPDFLLFSKAFLQLCSQFFCLESSLMVFFMSLTRTRSEEFFWGKKRKRSGKYSPVGYIMLKSIIQSAIIRAHLRGKAKRHITEYFFGPLYAPAANWRSLKREKERLWWL